MKQLSLAEANLATKTTVTRRERFLNEMEQKRGKLKAMQEGPTMELTRRAERLKVQLRSGVKHPFHVVKNLFGHRKVRYRDLAKNTAQL